MQGPSEKKKLICGKRKEATQLSIDQAEYPTRAIGIPERLQHRADPQPVRESAKKLGVRRTRLNQAIRNAKLTTPVLRKNSPKIRNRFTTNSLEGV